MCFLQGYQYKTILKFLGEIKMSLRTLKTRLKQLKLGRRNLMNETTAQQLDTTVLLQNCRDRVAIQVIDLKGAGSRYFS